MKIKANMSKAIKETPEIKAEKEKHKKKRWKNLSSPEKDRIFFALAKAAGAVPEDMLFE